MQECWCQRTPSLIAERLPLKIQLPRYLQPPCRSLTVGYAAISFTWASCSASPLGAICHPGDRWQHLGPVWWLHLRDGRCHRCAVGKGRGCCWTGCNTRVSSSIKESLRQSRGGETLEQGDQSSLVYAAVISCSKCILNIWKCASMTTSRHSADRPLSIKLSSYSSGSDMWLAIKNADTGIHFRDSFFLLHCIAFHF